MELSIFLAKAIGPVLIIVSLALLINRKNIDLLFDIYKNPGAVFLTGMLETFLGIMFVISHNIWTLDFRGFLTIIGWMLLARGIGRIFFPGYTARWLEKFKKKKTLFIPLLIVVLLIGLYLAYNGFTK